jgi:hypothetical protein
VLALLYQILYAYTFVGFLVLVVILPLNGWAVGGMQRARQEMIGKTDIRTRLLNEVLQAIKVVRWFSLCEGVIVICSFRSCPIAGQVLRLGVRLPEAHQPGP